MAKIRNAISFLLLLLIWTYLYVPNRFAFIAGVDKSPNLDLLFFWFPSVLGIAAYASFCGIWWIRLASSLAPPMLIMVVVYSVALIGGLSSEYAASTIGLILFGLRWYIIALLVCVAIFEIIARLRSRRGAH
jgi:hypothetical protein